MSVLIIAEAGVNHNGDIGLAKALIDAAADAGADVVKFQTFVAEEIVSKAARKADYQVRETGQQESQYEMLKRLELSWDDFVELKEYCQKAGILFLSTPFDFDSIDFLETLEMPFWKIPSGEITNLPYLMKIAKTGRDVVLSTGMSNIEEIRQAVGILRDGGAGQISLLHCNTEYPTPMQDVNLNAMLTLKKEFGLSIGYSDHTQGIEIPVAAVAMGAGIIEKHFTLDKKMTGPDHKASLEPAELKVMVEAVRNVEQAMGSADKAPSPSEFKNILIARKSIVAKRDIKKGEVFSEDNITVKRPGNGISPMRWFEVMGKASPRDFEEDELIEV
jgi:N,N'-diacetyllegionaminate synthase